MNYRFSMAGRLLAAIAGSAAIALTFSISPTLALDPFRTENRHEIGDRTATAFRTLFEQGNYQEALRKLQQAEQTEPNEPLVYAMQGALAYLDEDWDRLNNYATRTRTAAESLLTENPLRGNLYIAVGHFLEGGYIISTEGTLRGVPKAMGKLREVFKHFDAAEKIEANDPELNLIKGFMDLMLAVNLPFANADDAIARLENYAAPSYLAYRGIAVGHRDLDNVDQALSAVNRALEITPDNPELFYLKGQILVKKGNDLDNMELLQQAESHFQTALVQSEEKFPETLRRQLQRERDRNVRKMQELAAASR
ncbi:Sll0314/Alr1548 family TPR repeat-containing protein [Oscillatoria sp. HE19RPO]|uniref:Sll0314/Alr1548 family TPR repeat-containing protein n=1 Tax=Oscillatoria sp. HE19RPO TaxID=2954806 RepID=UPI0020C3808B|nr:Sll0314/Alr1548 family TPR repeat-containing protein [Oscillatoria sp. HE19RPO]